MEQKSLRDYLNQFFQEITLNGLTEENLNNIEVFLSQVIDSSEVNIFGDILIYNFLNLLKNQNSSTFILNHLIKEVELKGLRLVYLGMANGMGQGCQGGNNQNNGQNQNRQNCECNRPNGNNNGNRQQQRQSSPEEEELKKFNDTPLSEVLQGMRKEVDGKPVAEERKK